jgi:predicted choloylglycine hydrolase
MAGLLLRLVDFHLGIIDENVKFSMTNSGYKIII